ncbi:DUF429 domain-containing protein [Nocardioides aurantiacus]|uniref:Putative RNase H-like nuclease n=1 Tax=Nocardioides aurantiacus TaxID=86796 RepID=A0A3N2CZA6_9ACTN|nr:DUF429 domain-containing protein [Nocardioides aurantiacus]ROR92875.1 putative RNase H-like nuclease [Nocardioides aurantiacus]
MFHIGVDLAWGRRQPTGVAVLDDEGRLVQLAAVRTDEEILALLAPYVDGPCTVALDAPLVVTNPTGNRPAERALNADFARFDAGAHPSNTGKREFADGTRGGALAERLGLDLDPHAHSPRAAIEVYPHAATISLFRLGRTLKYKNKQGRDLEQLRGELLVLMGLLEGLGGAEPALQLTGPGTYAAGVVEAGVGGVGEGGAGEGGAGWTALRRQVQHATRKSELRVVEDQVDAVVCAYVALFAARRPDEITSYGDAATGMIVTPRLPEDHQPTPRPRRGPQDTSPPPPDPVGAVREYALRHPGLVRAGEEFLAMVTGILDDAGINYLTVTGRTKTVASFAEKARRLGLDGEPLYPDAARQIADTIGLRVITYVHGDVDTVADLLREQLLVRDDRDMGQETAQEGRFGYASRHLQVALDPERPVAAGLEPLVGLTAQVQIRTVLQHAWAEFEHDIRYKGSIPEEHAHDFDRRFTLAAGLLELADREFSTIRDTLRAPERRTPSDTGVEEAATDPRAGIEPRDLAAFLAGQYAEAGWSRTDHYAWIAGLTHELGLLTLADLAQTLREVDETVIAERMDYRYPPGAVRRLDDALLLAFGDAYVALHGNAHRRDLLDARLARLHAPPG